MRSKLPADKAMDRSQLQIGWMKGITLARRKDSTATPSRPGTKGSGLFSPDFHDHHWAEPETIQDEFLRISNQLPNVSWEGIDMDALLLNASLKGPWGPDGEAIFIKVKVDIPASYPRSKAPKFTIEQTSFMPDATRRKLEREINDIANQFLKRKANCLDVVFSYLLGEVDLEASTTLFKNVRDLDDDLDALADESSSEDDENDLPGGGSASMSQELTASAELDPSAVLASGRRTAVPPPPRLCGAQFANDGRLVCFFPTKEQKVKALFSLSSPDSARERSKGQPSFAGFGRLGQDSPHPRPQYAADEASATEDQGSDSDASVSSTSSSDSDSTTLHEISLWRNPGLKFRKTWSANESVRSSGGGTGAGTGTGTGTSRKRPGKPKNVVSLHDFRDMLPSKKQFAEEYAIFGDGAEVCKHNASVASKYGYPDLVSIWEYAALLLRKGIPLELHERLDRDESVLVIARDAVSRTRDEEAADEPSFSGIGQNQLSGRVKWGYHPLARDFIEDLFDYFERLADIQMLAMLSCVFGNSSAEHSAAYAESRLTQRETPLPMKAPSFSLEYFPTDPSLWNSNYKSQVSSAITTPRTAHTPAMYSDSPVSEDLAWPGDMAPRSSSHAETPPKSAKDRLREPGQTQSLSTSPESRTFLKSHPAVAALAASIPRPLAHALSRSPPEPLTRKKPSPADTSLSNPPPTSVTWGGSTVMGGAATDPTGPSRASMSDDGYRRRERVSMVPMCISYIPENQHLFDDDGWLSTSFIPEERDALCASYRYAYAEMLQVWGQPLARLEIMKFNLFGGDRTAAVGGNVYHDGATAGTSHEAPSNNTETDRHSIRETGATSPNIPLGSRKEQLQALLASDRGLDVTGICRVHEIQLDPLEYARPSDGRFGGAVGTCHRCHEGKVPQTQLRCVFCAEPIDALYPACLNCGCASHEDCLAEWHEAGETECPAGDECVCVLEANHGQVESWQALRAAITSSAGRRAAEHLLADDDDEDHHGLRPPPEDAATHRARRTSVPARIGAYFHLSRADEDGDSYDETRSLRGVQGGRHRAESRAHGGGDRDADEESTAGTAGSGREDWESVSSSQGIPSLSTLFGGKPAPVGQEPVSAARLSLGNRLKKPLGGGEAARPASLRRKSGGVAAWKKSVGLG
ncbi:hypothetical protein VTK73DRAFT_9081 [Phialemonium thermophilum]|uniref:RWD domain-containing protein n=1 Tax=Phialemonium thermophilum TaxID=223376 RepID=A0ABR3W4L7_9PEZI